jgi:acyl transferase domain-containing protein/NADPH:quinone reductase-like Zn-dependent oxidoreductase
MLTNHWPSIDQTLIFTVTYRQGAQWWAMGRELYDQYPVYASALERANAHLSTIGASFSLLDELWRDEKTTQVNAAHVSQPACTAVQLALVELLHSWKVFPAAVVGHSSGEIAAAYSAGIISFEDSMTIAYHRGRLVPVLKERYPALDGCMMAVGAGATEISPLLERIPHELGEARIACINSPSSVTISGDAGAVDELHKLIEAANPGMFARRLAVDTAYHSHHMNLLAKDYTKALRKLQPPRPSRIRFHSSLLGRLASYSDLDASYWVQNLTCAVRFDEAVQSLCAPVADSKTGVNFLIEVGPHAALQGPLKQILKHVGGPVSKIGYAAALSRKKDAVQTALALAGTLFVKGTILDMGAINFPKPLLRLPSVLTDMPRYEWNHATKYYHESRLTTIHKFHDAPRNDLIGVLAPYTDDIDAIWRNILRLDDIPWLRHHQIQGVTIFPISGFVIMAIEAIAQLAKGLNMPYDSLEVEDLSVKTPAMLSEEELEMTTTLRPNPDSQHSLSFSFHIRSWSKSKGWTEHCTGFASACRIDTNDVNGSRMEHVKKRKLDARLARMKEQVTHRPVIASELYTSLSEIGISYGATLQNVEGAQASPSASIARITVSDTAAEMPESHETKYLLHPAVLEKLVIMYWPILSASGPLSTVHLPSSIGKVTVSAKVTGYLQDPTNSMQAFCEPLAVLSDTRSNKLSVVATSDAGELLVSIENLLISPIVETDIAADVEGTRELCYKMEWEPAVHLPVEAAVDGQPQFDNDVLIVHGDNASQYRLASILSDQLFARTGVRPMAGLLASLAEVSQDKLCIFIAELHEPLLASLGTEDFESLQHLLTKVNGALWVVRGAYAASTNPNANMILGLSRTLRSEGTLMSFITLDLDGGKELDEIEQTSTIVRVFMQSLGSNSKTGETEFMERDGVLLTPRMVNDTSLNEYVSAQVHPTATEPASFLDLQRPLTGALKTPNVFDSLVFEDQDLAPLAEDEVEIEVKAIGLNNFDTEVGSSIGHECSGKVVTVGSAVPNLRVGDRVAGFTPNGSLSTVTRAQHPFLFKLPDHTTFESAATLPLAYSTASYALIDQARLCEGETLLIHHVASAVGQAVLLIAQMVEADVWVTVKSADEKLMLMRELNVPEGRILYAGNHSFVENIMDATSGRGIDVVFDTLTESHFGPATSEVLADFGRLIHVGPRMKRANCLMKGNTQVISVDIIALSRSRPLIFRRTLADVARLLKYGKIQPIHDIKTYGISGIVAALHDIQVAGPHSNVVIVPRDNESVMVCGSSSL